MNGLEIARRFYVEDVRPLLADVRHAAALLGDGSEVLGFDDDVSPDHDFGARVQVFVGSPVESLVELPDGVTVTTPEEFFRERLDFDPADGVDLADWLTAPTQRLATLVAGEVFADPDGWLATRREALRWYPDDVWRYVLAAQWLRISQEEAFVGRTGGVGDKLGSAVVGARLVRDYMRLAFLVCGTWAPYSKWLGTAFGRLPLAETLGPSLASALKADGWREREAALCEAGRVLGEATNALGLCEPLDPAPRRYYTRDIQVVDAARYTVALAGAVEDEEVRALVEQAGLRREPVVARLAGAIDQVVDNVDVLTHPERCRAVGRVLLHGSASLREKSS